MILICICLHTLFQFPKSDSIFHLKHYPLPVALTLFPTPQDLFEQHALFNNTLCDCKKYIYIPSTEILLSLALHTPLENLNTNTGTTDGWNADQEQFLS